MKRSFNYEKDVSDFLHGRGVRVVARGSNEPMVGWPRDSPRPGLPAPGLRAPGRGGAEAGGREVGPGHGRRWHQPTIGRVAGAGSGRGTVR